MCELNLILCWIDVTGNVGIFHIFGLKWKNVSR